MLSNIDNVSTTVTKDYYSHYLLRQHTLLTHFQQALLKKINLAGTKSLLVKPDHSSYKYILIELLNTSRKFFLVKCACIHCKTLAKISSMY